MKDKLLKHWASLLYFGAVAVMLSAGLIAQTLAGWKTEKFELVDKGQLSAFSGGPTYAITLDGQVHVIDTSRWSLKYTSPVDVGAYYYLYKDTIGGLTLSRPYLLTKENLDAEEDS